MTVRKIIDLLKPFFYITNPLLCVSLVYLQITFILCKHFPCPTTKRWEPFSLSFLSVELLLTLTTNCSSPSNARWKICISIRVSNLIVKLLITCKDYLRKRYISLIRKYNAWADLYSVHVYTICFTFAKTFEIIVLQIIAGYILDITFNKWV